jgi:cation diffusion facilitator CzcD-associated flavoprotein CzcO
VTTLEADYLVVGAGAMGMAFTDTLVTETDAQVVIVDRGHAPGGHWRLAIGQREAGRPTERPSFSSSASC